MPETFERQTRKRMSTKKRKKSLTPEPGGAPGGVRPKKQQTLFAAFAKIDRAIAETKSKPSSSMVDLTNRPSASGLTTSVMSQMDQGSQQKSVSQQPQRSVSHVSASLMELNSKRAATATSGYQNVSHVSDTYKPKSVQGSVLGDNAADSLADEASSPTLCPEQERVLQLVMEGHNVFFTGNAGTGKTFMLNQIIAELKRKYGRDFAAKVALAAPTGIAATHIQGTTLNSALGIGACNFHEDFDRILKDKTATARIRQWEVLVVDEVSMLSAEFFQQMEAKLRSVRGVGKPAGGLQLVMCGDFFQLPPVSKRWAPGTPLEAFLNWGYAFQAPAWKTSSIKHVLLTKVFRQQEGSEFVRILDDIRYGRNVLQALTRLRDLCMRPLPSTDGIKPTQLFSRNKEVDGTNELELSKLPGNLMVFKAADEVQLATSFKALPPDDPRKREAEARMQRHEFFRECTAPSDLRLKVGAQVMLLKNLDLEGGHNNSRQLVNGSRGVVVGALPKEEKLRELELEFKALGGKDRQRISSMDLRSQQKLGALQRQIDFLVRWQGRELPVVRFRNGAEMVILPSAFSTTVQGLGECRRLQLPLKLAWALTIHKCQGLTLDLVQVSLKAMFAQGQAYVALSRARSLEGLQILDWDPGCVQTNPAVAAFYMALKDGDVTKLKDDAWDQWMVQRRGEQPGKDTAAAAAGTAAAGGSGALRPITSSIGSQQQPWQGKAFSGPGGSRDRSGDKCFHCNGSGHWASNCPTKRVAGGGTGGGGSWAQRTYQQRD